MAPHSVFAIQFTWIPSTTSLQSDSYEARTPQLFVVFGVRHASVSVSDTDTTPYYILYFGHYKCSRVRVRVVSVTVFHSQTLK